MNYMTNKIVAIQGDIPSKLNPETDTSIFLANEIQNKRYKKDIIGKAYFRFWPLSQVGFFSN